MGTTSLPGAEERMVFLAPRKRNARLEMPIEENLVVTQIDFVDIYKNTVLGIREGI
jgi:hypothetical protein